MWDLSIRHHFHLFKFYISAVTFFILIFLFFWIPWVEINLTLASEPFVVNFEVKLDAGLEGVFFNLDTIGAKVINVSPQESQVAEYPPESGWQYIQELKDEKGERIIVFQEKNLEDLIDYKIKALLGPKKRIFKPAFQNWKIEVLSKSVSDGRAKLLLGINEKVIGVYDFDNIKEALIFKRPEAVKEMFKKIGGIKDVQIKHHPGFYKRMPNFPARINISFQPA